MFSVLSMLIKVAVVITKNDSNFLILQVLILGEHFDSSVSEH